MTERTYRPLTRHSAKLCERALAIAEGRLERTYQGEYPSDPRAATLRAASRRNSTQRFF